LVPDVEGTSRVHDISSSGVFRRTCSAVRTVTDTITYSLFGGMLVGV